MKRLRKLIEKIKEMADKFKNVFLSVVLMVKKHFQQRLERSFLITIIY